MDSTMAAILLKEEGHDIIGITARLHGPGPVTGESRDDGSIASAKTVAEQYGFPLEVRDLRDLFSSIVVDPFCKEYLAGRTPNPCILCNCRIKFGSLLKLALELGCGRLATGHYAGIGGNPEGRYYVSMARDRNKDQSYFLAMLTQDALKRAMFPLGNHTKEEVRMMARERGIPQAERVESQEICFIPDNDYPAFIAGRKKPPPAGDIVDPEGRVIGRHRGMHHYTIGQRRGLGISAPRPLYVISIDPARNVIVAGAEEYLWKEGLFATGINYMKHSNLDGRNVLMKTRSTQTPFSAILTSHGDGVLARFEEPQGGISPGQTAVFYDGNMDIAGAGIIEEGISRVDNFLKK